MAFVSPALILASSSPRRLALLEQIGIFPNAVLAPQCDESVLKSEAPRNYALRIATLKAKAAKALVAQDKNNTLILAADTVVCVGLRILPKAMCDQDVHDCLLLLSGKSHRVYTAIALLEENENLRTRLCETRVKFKRLSSQDIETYIQSQEGIGKAGGYAIQGRAAAFVTALIGSYTSVVGLPLYETQCLLQGRGYIAKRAVC